MNHQGFFKISIIRSPDIDGAICSKKIEKLSHIMGTAPLLDNGRAYGFRPRLWLLLELNDLKRELLA